MITRRSWLVYGVLVAIWVVLLGWQTAEHLGVRRSARNDLRHRAEVISSTLASIMRSQPFFVRKDRIETVLKEMVAEGEVFAVELRNVKGEPVASAGPPIELPTDKLAGGELWDPEAQTVTLLNEVNLGTNIITDFPNRRPGDGDGPPPGPPPDFGPPSSNGTNGVADTNALNIAGGTNNFNGTNGPGGPDGFRRNRRPRLSEEEIKKLIREKSAHDFIMVISAQSLSAVVREDIWLRAFIALLATVSVAGYGLAWSNAGKTSDLQIRLVRASELNSHLKEMNLAAAGLAHETRNPLNIVRGLAQMISKQEDASPEIRIKSREIIDETDRVAAQLNEFINYSRPREVRRATTELNSVVKEVVRALNYDIEEKKVALQNLAEDLSIEADEQLLRQALFNLVINAIQAAPMNGEIQIRAGRQGNNEAFIEISDNGPGVALENRTEIFKPYFTTHEEGTGLGLAVVQQIVLAHGWEIEFTSNTPSGANFRITHVKLTTKG